MGLEFRLKILKDSKQISEKTYADVKKIISIINEGHNMNIIDENGGMFISHIAIAIERIKNNEAIKANSIDDGTYQEIINNEHFEECKNIVCEIRKEIGINIPETEERFIIIHLCTLLNSA